MTTRTRSTLLWATAVGLLALSLGLHSSASGPGARVQSVQATATEQAETPREWGDWLEADAPFFSSVLDARHVSPDLPADNLTPRGLVLRAGDRHWVTFDTDLLRVSAMWEGEGVAPTALAPGSYHKPDKKTPGGQNALPVPVGTVWMANGIYPGWQRGERPRFDDPREPAPSVEEIGRGPIDARQGRFEAVRLTDQGAVLVYRVADAEVHERVTMAALPDSRAALVRNIEVSPSNEALWLVLGAAHADVSVTLGAEGDESQRPTLETMSAPLPRRPADAAADAAPQPVPTDVWVVRVPASAAARRFAVAVAPGETAPQVSPQPLPTAPAPQRWPQVVETRVVPSTSAEPYVVDDVPLPLDNPWRRNLRVGDIQFLADGTGVVVTLDGDVWTLRGVASPEGVVRWRRFASGLHEPLTLAIRDGDIHVFDRNGIWRLRDTNGDGEADRHELFSNAFAQTADMREFPATIRLGPKGEFVIAKGGQEATTLGKHNGSILRVSADGRASTVLGYGLRQPNLAVHPTTGLVTSSDQQGHYIPTTPLHIVRDKQFYGFLSDKRPREVYPAPIADPLVWIPHAVNASAMSQVWLVDAKMGPLNEQLVHIGYNRPEVFQVLLDLDRPKPQATVVSITSAFDYPPLNGSVNPADGQLYIGGFQILGWGTTATRMAGLGRVRYTGGEVTLPREVTPTEQGLLLRFGVPLDAAAAENPAHYTVSTWKYQRTYRYGSPQLKADGTPGTDVLVPSRAYLSKDARSVFVAVPGMTPVMQLQVGWRLQTRDGVPVERSAWTTPYELEAFDPKAEGFGDLVIDLTPRTTAVETDGTISVAEGRRVYEQFGCMACHSVERGGPTRLGPPLVGVFGASRPIANRPTPVMGDEAYLRSSILEPASAIVSGFERSGTGMPSYAGVLTDAEVSSVILFIKSLK